MIDFSLALISLPGAHLAELAGKLSALTGVPVIDFARNSEEIRLTATEQPSIITLPSDFLEKHGKSSIQSFRETGGKLVFLMMTWEDSWKAVANDGAANAQGLPWRAAYRQLARERISSLRAASDLEVSGTGSLDEIARRIFQEIA